MSTAGRGRKDLELATSFLVGLLDSFNEGDYCKIWCLTHYMHSDKDFEAIIGIDDIKRMRTFVAESHVVYPNMQSHTGGVISCGNRVLHLIQGNKN